MKLIIADLNGSTDLSDNQINKISKECASLGIENPEFFSTIEQLGGYVIEHHTDSLLLFTNFPPDSSYPGSGKSMKLVEKEDIIERSWEADSYSNSAAFFGELAKSCHFRGVHFLTGAPEIFVSDNYLRSFFLTGNITITRKKDWIQSQLPYSITLKNFIIDKIRLAAIP